LFSQKIGFALLGLKKNRAGIGRLAHASLEVSGGARVASHPVNRSMCGQVMPGHDSARLCGGVVALFGAHEEAR
jgi:hypothetical protein